MACQPLTLFRPSLLSLLVSLGFALSLNAGCGSDIGTGSQLAGQRCFSDSNCASGLVCNQRQCVPESTTAGEDATDAGPTTDGGPVTLPPPPPTIDVGIGVDAAVPPDGGGCAPGQRRCIEDAAFVVCVEDQDGTTRFTRFVCDDGFFCEGGECRTREEACVDADGDGYDGYDPFTCSTGHDCDDDRARVNPGEAEDCQTPFDDNCDGVIDEGCDPNRCCPHGCADGEFCNSWCACEAFDPAICRFQNQPCAVESPNNNGFRCIDLGGDELRCMPPCDPNAPDPDATCPDEGSFCASGGGGICLVGCDPERGCGSETLGCLPLDPSDRGGVCLPTSNAIQVGDRCELGVFNECVAGALCADVDRDGVAHCREACRPFTGPANGTDCSQGHCLPAGGGMGLCFPDNGSTGNQQCSPVDRSTCGADGVGCFPRPNGQARCTELCRLAEGSGDCDGQARCISIGRSEIGVCRPGSP